MSSALERELRIIKERISVLWGERGGPGHPERAVRLREIGNLGSGGGGGGVSLGQVRAALLSGGVSSGDTTHAPTGDAVHSFVLSMLEGAAYYYGPGLPSGGSYANGDRAFDTDTGREYTRIGGAWLDLNGSGGLAARATATLPSGTGSVAIGKSAVLVELQASDPARCRFYCAADARDADADRAPGEPVPQGAGLVLEFIATEALLGAPLAPAPTFYNLDDPVSGLLYYNIEPAGGPMFTSLTYLPLGN